MAFYCRENELSKLNKRYKTGKWECIVIYGRRRVGKTALINEFCKDKATVYFSALNAGANENLEALSSAIGSFCGIEDAPVYRSFDDAFSGIEKLSREKHIVFVIDEYPYLAKADPSISSRLQHIIDHRWQESSIFLILCGSSMSFMQNQVLGYESPLYGRRTAQFLIEPLTYRETAVFRPELSAEDKAILYGITGGVPHYINKLDVKDDLREALLENFFDRSAYLFEEPDNLLKQELREPAVYNSIIRAISDGHSKLNEISTKVGIESGSCSRYINTLTELGIVQKEIPVTEKAGKKTIYSIADNLFRFWYRFVPQNIPAIVSGRIETNFDHMICSKLHDYMGLVFEKMCRDYLMRYADDLPFEIAETGQWWGTDPKARKEVQIDIVGVPAEGAAPGEYIIGSCKFRNMKIGTDELELLENYASVFGKGKKYHYYIFSLGGFTDELIKTAGEKGVRLITAEDMYI
ncbi:MAG: ATP-binding protein [Oscillospiraceae bacterium]|nr:ATP-binding protein [Oscillospiraceae bacterium]